MSKITIDLFSNTMQVGVNVIVLLPYDRAPWQSKKANHELPVVYLLHGLSDDHTAWTRNTSVERYANEAGVAVVMPCGHRSFYHDMASGPAYYTYVSEELPLAMHQMFGLSSKREQSFIAGLSMGGYGAFKIALQNPNRFKAAFSFSGALDIAHFFLNGDAKEIETVFGTKMPDGKSGLFQMAEKILSTGEACPLLYQNCGAADFLYEGNLKFRDFAREKGLPLTYQEEKGAAHTWDVWDRNILQAMQCIKKLCDENQG